MNSNSFSEPYVSIVVPIRNEEKNIRKFIEQLEKQTYSKEKMEVIFADGDSDDNTVQIIKDYIQRSSLRISCYQNEKKNAPSGVNLGISKAKGTVIIRMDAHTVYDVKYVEKNVYYLTHDYGDNVGCPIDTVGVGVVGETIAYILSTKFGVGNSEFRTSRKAGETDTVPFGCFYRELIDKIGNFAETLPSAEDNDFNFRIREFGGKIYQFNDIVSTYYSRTNIADLVAMAYGNGKSVADLMKKDKKAVSMRHLIPFAFFMGNLVGILSVLLKIKLIRKIYLSVMGIYIFLDCFFSIKGIGNISVLQAVISLILYPIFHLSYGFGTLKRIVAGKK